MNRAFFVAAVSALFALATAVRGDIFQWEYINPADPSQGKRQSTTLAPDGAGIDAVPGADLASRDLTGAYLIGASLRSVEVDIPGIHYHLAQSNLTSTDLTQAELSNANLTGAILTEADFTDANVEGANFGKFLDSFRNLKGTGIALAQLYSTASYQAKDLSRIRFDNNNLVGGNFTGQNLTNAAFYGATLTAARFSQANLANADFTFATLTDADFTGADVRGVNFDKLTDNGTGITLAQLYSTASYQARDLTGIRFYFNNLASGNFAGQNLTDAHFSGSTLTDSDFTDADVRGATFDYTTSKGFTSAQLYSTASYKFGNLTGISLDDNDLSGWNFAGQNLTNAVFRNATLTDADFTGASLRKASFEIYGHGTGISPAQLYSTASYQDHDLREINLVRNDLRGWNFTGQNLINANFLGATLTDADFTGAEIPGANFGKYFVPGGALGTLLGTGISLEQLYSTASYQAHHLSGIGLYGNQLTRANLAGQNLTGADLRLGLPGVDLTAADIRGAYINPLGSGVTTKNSIWSDGRIRRLDLDAGDMLVVRDYDGVLREVYGRPLGSSSIRIDEHLKMAPGGTLRMVFEADDWDSMISFAPGIPVTLGGTLELTFAADVNFASQVGRTLDLFNWTGVSPTGRFQLRVSSGTMWDASKLYTAGEVTVLPIASDVTVPPGGSYVAGGLSARSLTLAGEGSRLTIASTGGPGRPATVNSLSIASGATLDVTDNVFIVDYAGASPVATIREKILSGRDGPGIGGTWSGTGITSSTAATANQTVPDSRSLGYAENASLPLGPYTTFQGSPVDSNSVLIAFTRTGDANLDGVVNDDDVTIVGAAYAPGVPQPHWALGDFDYNGSVDDDDVTLLGAFYDPSAPPLAVSPTAATNQVSAVPEPSTVTLLGVMLAGLVITAARRRLGPRA